AGDRHGLTGAVVERIRVAFDQGRGRGVDLRAAIVRSNDDGDRRGVAGAERADVARDDAHAAARADGRGRGGRGLAGRQRIGDDDAGRGERTVVGDVDGVRDAAADGDR